MIRGKCPICGKGYEIATLADLPSFPFCNDRCRMVDLGRWIDGAYAVPASRESNETEDEPEIASMDDEDTSSGRDE